VIPMTNRQFKIEQAASPNFHKGRDGQQITAIVNHITAGLMPGTLSWLRNPKAKASAHYLVTKDGRIFQMVKDTDTAWHSGFTNRPSWPLLKRGINPNKYTIGIEHECLSGGALTEEQYQATLWLHRYLCDKWRIVPHEDTIIGHCRIDSVNRPNDPGSSFPWKRLFEDLRKGEQEEVLSEVKIKVDGKVLTGFIKDNSSYAPVRALAESLGAKVSWDEKTKTVLIEGRK